MRGLAFPSNADIDRETSHEYGTPISNVDDIPIDPALEGGVIDPVLISEADGTNGVKQPQPEQPFSEHNPPPIIDFKLPQFSEVLPEGDPFAQAPYFPIEQEQLPPPPPKPKRKRKVRREETCSFCRGDESQNKLDQPEILLTCHECGRSGHPSCMQLTRVTDVVHSYPWKCIECKNCELCQEKGDDDRILFCDWCDRGWHLDCMNPPLGEPPDGEWHCPECPPVNPEEVQMLDGQDFQENGIDNPIDLTRDSPSRSAIEPPSAGTRRGKNKVNHKSKGRTSRVAPIADPSDVDEDINIEVDDTPVATSKIKGRPRKSVTRQKALLSPTSEDEEAPITPVRAPKRRRSTLIPSTPPPATLLRVRLRIPGRGKGKEREEEEPSHGLFDDILSPEERDTGKTTITNADKLYFERSRVTAEEKLVPAASSPTRTLETLAEFISDRPRPLRSTTIHQSTPLSKRFDFDNNSVPSTPGGSSIPPLKFEPGVLRIRGIRFGPYDIKTWYDAPFPEEYASIPDGRLWICEFCLKYMKSPFAATRHQMKCKIRHPPGDEIYRDGPISIFEVDGRRNKIYCQNLCLLSKMFLDHKSLFYDVEPFLFYVIAQVDEYGARFVGYFSKEKRCPKDYNLSCIMTLPVRQRQGWGNMLIDFSYLLSRIEQRLGSPEKPLSSLGALGYRNYWTLAVMRFLQTGPDNLRIEDICSATSMTVEDVCQTLTQQNMLFIHDPTPLPIRPSPGQSIKFPRGRKNGLARRQLQRLQIQDKDDKESHGPNNTAFIPPKHYEIHFDREKVNDYVRNWEKKGYVKLKPDKLQWTPYLTTRNPQEANLPVLPAMDPTLDGSSKTTSTQPTTPTPQVDCSTESLVVDGEEEEEELPSVIERPGRTRTSTKMVVKEKDLTLRTTRSHRAASSPPVSTLLTPSRTMRTRSSNATVSPSPEEPVSDVRVTRRGVLTNKSSRRTMEDVVNNDEAFAAKLAMEEQMQQSRQLRSRRNDAHSENMRPVPPTLPKSRKRRRIDSPSEVVESLASEEQAAQESEEPMDVDAEVPLVNGDRCTHTPEWTLVDGNNQDAVEEESAVVREMLEVKSEDAGTPLTSLTSRQSLPSDDTVTGSNYAGMKHAESDMRSTLTPGMVDLDECHDEDADGEYEEEDAEGEPDPEY